MLDVSFLLLLSPPVFSFPSFPCRLLFLYPFFSPPAFLRSLFLPLPFCLFPLLPRTISFACTFSPLSIHSSVLKSISNHYAGAYAPYPGLSLSELDHIRETILQPAVDGMRVEGRPYHGVLYAGIMLTRDGPRVLEFNCRFGDPETQVILPLMTSDLLPTLLACVPGASIRLADVPPIFSKDYAVAVVMASEGYPAAYPKGRVITGLDPASHQLVAAGPNVHVFHAGSQLDNGQLVTAGGRVLAVSSVAPTLKLAVVAAYAGLKTISFEGCRFRNDIAACGLVHLATKITYRDAGVDIDAGDRLVLAREPHTCIGKGRRKA